MWRSRVVPAIGRHKNGRWHLALAVAAAAFLSAAIVGQGTSLDIFGTFTVDTTVVPIPATLVDEIQLDAPAKLTSFKFGVDSMLDLSMAYGDSVLHINTSMSVPGLERFIVDATMLFGGAKVKGEMWFAVPFETVIDINHFINWVVIPPGDLMFVKTRITTEFMLGGLDVHNLFMIEDVEFPNPNADFGPLFYPVQSQSFHVGDILTIAGEPLPGITLTSVTSFCASAKSNAVIGWSARGSVSVTSTLCDTFCFTETISVRGLEYCGVSVWFSLAVNPCDDPVLELTGGGAFSGVLDVALSGSFSLLPIDITGFTLSTTLCDTISASIRLSDGFKFEAASLRSQANVDTGIMQGNVFGNCTITSADGVTSCIAGAMLTHGTISAGLSCAFAQQAGSLRLVSTTFNGSYTLAPAVFSISMRFGRYGLVEALLSVGISF